jgi:hypothetical protein
MAFSPSKQQIADILPHLRYEIEQSFVVPAHDQNDWHIRESVFLAMLVHARLLLDFFEHSPRAHDDVLCADFGFPAAPVPLSSDDRLRLNKDIAHLTYSRLRHTPATKPWPWEAILAPLRERAAAFVLHIVSSPPQGGTDQELAQWRTLLEAFTQTANKPVQPTAAALFMSTASSNTAPPTSATFHSGGCG